MNDIWTPAKLTHKELTAMAVLRFGDNALDIAFECPNCRDIAAIRDWPEDARDRAGQECIGRSLGALDAADGKWDGRGCTFAAYGLIPGPWTIVMPDGQSVRGFPLADAPAATAEGAQAEGVAR